MYARTHTSILYLIIIKISRLPYKLRQNAAKRLLHEKQPVKQGYYNTAQNSRSGKYYNKGQGFDNKPFDRGGRAEYAARAAKAWKHYADIGDKYRRRREIKGEIVKYYARNAAGYGRLQTPDQAQSQAVAQKSRYEKCGYNEPSVESAKQYERKSSQGTQKRDKKRLCKSVSARLQLVYEIQFVIIFPESARRDNAYNNAYQQRGAPY